MDLVNKIDIQVTKAVINSINISFDAEKNGIPDIGICVHLMTSHNKKISEVTLHTKQYYGLTIDRSYFPASVDSDIANIVKQIAPIVARRINQIENLLEA